MSWQRTILRTIAALLVPLVAGYAGSASGQAWPNKPLKMLVGATPGGTTDIVARVRSESFCAIMFDTVAAALPHVKAGKMRAIAVGGKQRLAALPDVPTLQEAGLPDFEIRSWYGVIAPAKTPPEIIERISREIAEIVKAADVRENFASQMLEPVGSTPQDFGNFIRVEMRQWEPVAKSANIKME